MPRLIEPCALPGCSKSAMPGSAHCSSTHRECVTPISWQIIVLTSWLALTVLHEAAVDSTKSPRQSVILILRICAKSLVVWGLPFPAVHVVPVITASKCTRDICCLRRNMLFPLVLQIYSGLRWPAHLRTRLELFSPTGIVKASASNLFQTLQTMLTCLLAMTPDEVAVDSTKICLKFMIVTLRSYAKSLVV